MKTAIAGITGLGGICAAGASLKTIMPSLYSGKRSPAAPATFSTEIDKISPVFEVPWSLAVAPSVTGASESSMQSRQSTPSRTSLLAQTAVIEALEHACLDKKSLQDKRAAAVI